MEKGESRSLDKKSMEVQPEVKEEVANVDALSSDQKYVLHKWRFPGIFGLVVLNVVAGMNWPWFGSISAESTY